MTHSFSHCCRFFRPWSPEVHSWLGWGEEVRREISLKFMAAPSHRCFTRVAVTAAGVSLGLLSCFLALSKFLQPKSVNSRAIMHAPRNPSRCQCADIVVMYASCGGTAKGLATMLAESLRDRGVINVVLLGSEEAKDFETFSSILSSCRLCLAVVATTGDGTVPYEFLQVFSFLRKYSSCPALRYAQYVSVLGLGDSKYRQFCKAALDVTKCFSRCSFLALLDEHDAKATMEGRCWCSDAADENSHEGNFSRWSELVVRALRVRLGVEVGPIPSSPPAHLRFQVTPVSSFPTTTIATPFVLSPSMMEPTPTRPGRLRVSRATPCLPEGSNHPIVHVVLDVTEYPRLSYEAGDHIGILAPNARSVVECLLTFLDEGRSGGADVPLKVHQNSTSAARASPASTFPHMVVTWRHVLTWYLDISRFPSLHVLRHMVRCCSASSVEKNFMMQRLSDELQWQRVVEEVKRHHPEGSNLRLVDILRHTFPLCSSVPLSRLCECLPLLQPRFYSIASDPISHPGSLEIFVRVLKDGVASPYLASQPSLVFGFIRKSQFHLPKNRSKPILMIGPGTGLAPLMGFLHRRGAQHKKQRQPSINGPAGQVWLFHGCRFKEDWTHRLESLVSPHLHAGTLSNLRVCFSREQARSADGSRCRYVQDLMKEQANDVTSLLLDPDSVVLVCGDAQHMARDVRDTIERLLSTVGGMDMSSARDYVRRMISTQRYLEDVW